MDPYLPEPGGRHAGRLILLAAAGAAAVAAVVALVISSAFGVMSGSGAAVSELSASGSYCISPAATQAAWGQWSAEQVTNAATIVRVGQSQGVPQQGWVIAVATAMQESSLINLDHGTLDSLGLFQQRPSQGWGTAAQVMDPVYASGQFYAHLMAVPGWQQMPLTVAAQAVQASANPGAYAQWAKPAASLVAHLAGAAGPAALAAASQAGTGCGPGQVPPGTPAQVKAVLAYAYSALGTLYDYGGTCTDPHSANMALHCDCSSLVQQSFLHGAGLQLPRTAEAQWQWGEAGHAVSVPIGQAQPGDVVYFPSYLGPDTIGHTGIITDPKTMTMINAPTTGQPVGFASYNPSGLPYGTHMFTILRFLSTGSGSRSGT